LTILHVLEFLSLTYSIVRLSGWWQHIELTKLIREPVETSLPYISTFRIELGEIAFIIQAGLTKLICSGRIS